MPAARTRNREVSSPGPWAQPGLRERHALTGNDQDRHRGTAAYRASCAAGAASDALWALQAAMNWGGWAIQRGAWDEAAEAYTHALTAMYGLVRAQVGRADQETSLRPAAELCGPATCALARAGHQREAVDAFERTRAVLLTEALQESRTDVRRLAQDAPELVTRYRAAAERLTQLTRQADDRLPVRLAGRREHVPGEAHGAA